MSRLTNPTWKVRPLVKQGVFFFFLWPKPVFFHRQTIKGSYNAGYILSGTQGATVGQLQYSPGIHHHNKEPKIWDMISRGLLFSI